MSGNRVNLSREDGGYFHCDIKNASTQDEVRKTTVISWKLIWYFVLFELRYIIFFLISAAYTSNLL